MVAEILSQDEINSLLNQAESGEIDSSGGGLGGMDLGSPMAAPSLGPAPVAPPPELPPAGDLIGRVPIFNDLPVKFSVEVGRSILELKEVLKLGKNSIIELQKLRDEPVDILVNGQKIAEGEVVIIDDNFGVSILRFLEDKEIIEFLNRFRK